MTAPEPSQQWTWLALIRRSQGRKGEVFADILTDFPEKFSERRHLWLVAGDTLPKTDANSGAHAAERPALPAQVELIDYWPHKGGIVLHFAGVDSIPTAEALAGLAVAIPQTERAPLNEDEAYVGDLIGCTVVDVAPAVPAIVGPIEDVDFTAGPVALLVVRGERGEILIPFAKSYLRWIDLDTKRVEMALPDGLIDLN